MFTSAAQPASQGLYDGRHEHDACGVAFVATLTGVPSHDIVDKALTALRNLEHRGASGAEPDSGDGAGILFQVPDRFLRESVDFELPAAGHYAVGIGFLPVDDGRRRRRARRRRGDRRRRRACGSSAGARCRPTRRWWAPPRAASCRRSGSSSSPRSAATSRASSWTAGRSRCASASSTSSACTSRRCRPAPSSTRACSPPASSSRSTPSCPTRGWSRRWPSCTRASPRTPSRPGRWRTPTGTSRTTARSTPCGATATGCRPARRMLTSNVMPRRHHPAVPDLHARAAATPPRSTRSSSCCTSAGRSLPHSVLMMIPEAWENNPTMDPARRAFYEFHAQLHGAVGRPRQRLLHRRHPDRRGPRPQRPAPGPLLGHRRRSRRAGLRGRRPRHRPGARSCARAGSSPATCSSSTPPRAASSRTTRSRRSSPRSTPTGSGCRPGLIHLDVPARARAHRAHAAVGRPPPADLRLHRGGAADHRSSRWPAPAPSRSARWAPTRRSRCCRPARG